MLTNIKSFRELAQEENRFKYGLFNITADEQG